MEHRLPQATFSPETEKLIQDSLSDPIMMAAVIAYARGEATMRQTLDKLDLMPEYANLIFELSRRTEYGAPGMEPIVIYTGI